MTRFVGMIFVMVLSVAALGCLPHYHHRAPTPSAKKAGPPPHAPAHGYRHKHHHDPNVVLIFDAGLGVYRVSGRKGHYFHDGHYYRFMEDVWYRSARIHNGWKVVGMHHLPAALVGNHKTYQHRKKSRRHPAKHHH